MRQEFLTVASREEVADGVFLLRCTSHSIARDSKPGQFVNVRVSPAFVPFLRRPFSICRVEGTTLELLFNVVGEGTRLLARMHPGDELDTLGPLGKPFTVGDDFDTAVIVAGGLGVAPFPFLTDYLLRYEKQIVSFVGARTAFQLYTRHLNNVHVATDDGSSGSRGTVVYLLERHLDACPIPRPKLFGCGPTRMLQALSEVARMRGIPCELSLEGEMACGVGLCQGCPVERVNGSKKYALVCVEGPTFDCTTIVVG